MTWEASSFGLCVKQRKSLWGRILQPWLISRCGSVIIADSIFNCWGGWLAGNPDKCVIAPGFEMREGKMWWGFDGLLPDEWIKMLCAAVEGEV